MEIFYIVITLTATLIHRSYLFRRFKKLNPEGDEISHLLMLKTIQQNGNRIPETIPQFILNYNDYPNGFHKLIAMMGLPTRFWEKNGGYVPILCDALLLLWIAMFVLMTGGRELNWLLLFPVIRLLWSREARSNDFGERAFGVLAGNIYLSSAYLLASTGNAWWLLPAILSFVLVSCSSKFGNQAVLFFSLLMGLSTWNWIYPTLYVMSLLITAVITRGYVLKVLRGQILYSDYYRRHRMERALSRNFYLDFLCAFKRFKLSRFSFFFFENPLFMLLTNCPANLAFLIIWGLNGFLWSDLTIYAFIGSLLGLLIASEPLKYMGQPERYLEFSLPAIFAVLARYTVPDYWWVFSLSLSLGLIAAFYHVTSRMRQQSGSSSRRDAYRQLKRFLARQPASSILTIPLKCANNLAYLLNKKHRYIGNFTHCRNREQYQIYESLMPDHYPFPTANLTECVQLYGVDLIVFLKSSKTHLNKLTGNDYYNFTQYEILYENDEFAVFKPAI